MSGFFLVRRDAVALEACARMGSRFCSRSWCAPRTCGVAEVGFHFGERFAGKSKASLREGVRYLAPSLAGCASTTVPLRFCASCLSG